MKTYRLSTTVPVAATETSMARVMRKDYWVQMELTHGVDILSKLGATVHTTIDVIWFKTEEDMTYFRLKVGV